MSLEYPCVYYKPGGLCEKYSTDGITSYCVQGPCPDQSLSNADRIRDMSDEELAKMLCIYDWRLGEMDECLAWLKRPEEEET